MKRTRILLSAIVGLALTAGASQATEEATWGQVKNTATDEIAAKRIRTNGQNADLENTVATSSADDGRTVTAVFGPDGGTFHILDKQGPGKKDDLEVALTIPAGALNNDQQITMTVEGNDFNSLLVTFKPSGLVFNLGADMRIDLGDDLVRNKDIAKMEPYHLYSDGTSEGVDVFHIDRSSNAVNIFCKVPGFSRYGLWSRY